MSDLRSAMWAWLLAAAGWVIVLILLALEG